MNILFIPHVPNRKIINRVYEFSKNSNSYFLSWQIENSSLQAKILSQLQSLFSPIKLEDDILTIPLLFKPESLATKLNTKMLNYAIKKFKIEMVVNANALLFDIRDISVPVFYDLVDDHITTNADIGLTPLRVKKIEQDIRDSRGVICVTKVLKEKVKYLNSNTITVENGLYIERFKQAKSLKKELGLEGKKVFGYIGGVDEWTGIDRACESYREIRDETTAMIVVGDSKSGFFRALKEQYKKEKYKEDIIFTGLISPDRVGDYFKTLDVGLIPFKLNNFTNNAYPIKALEYGLAGVEVISTPLTVLKEKTFPFIHFYDIGEFAVAMKRIEKRERDFDFSELSWQKQSRKLIDFIKKAEQ